MAENESASPQQIASLVERLGRLTRGMQHAMGFKPAQWEALRYLARANRHSRTPAALSDFLGSTRGTVSQTLITLEKKGLIRRDPSPMDGRSVELSLTPEGQELMEKDPLGGLGSIISTLTNHKALVANLEDLLWELQHRHGYVRFGTCKSCRYFRTNGAAAPGEHYRCALTGAEMTEEESGKICRDFARAVG